MNLLIENSGYHLRNLGDAAMLQAACRLILNHRPNARVRVFTTNPDRLTMLCPGVEPITPLGQSAWLSAKCYPLPRRLLPQSLCDVLFVNEKDYKYAYPEKALARMQRRGDYQQYHAEKVESWLAAIAWTDAVVATGGGYFTDAFGGHLEGLLHTVRWAQHKGKTTAFFGQGLGPLQSKRLRRLAGTALGVARCVSLREGLDGLTLGKSLGCNTADWKVTGDDAFVGLCSFKPTLNSGDILGINLRVASYAGVDKAAFTVLAEALEYTRAALGGMWMPLPVDLCPTRGDAPQTLSLLAEETLSPNYRLPTVPQDLVNLVSHCRAVITGSYHAAVFALALGTPVVAFAANAYYASKFKGLKTFFGDGVLIIDPTAVGLKSTLMEAVRSQWDMPNIQREHLVERARGIADSVTSFYQEFLDKL